MLFLEGALFNRPQKGPAWPVALVITLARELCPLAPNDAQKRNLSVWEGEGVLRRTGLLVLRFEEINFTNEQEKGFI